MRFDNFRRCRGLVDFVLLSLIVFSFFPRQAVSVEDHIAEEISRLFLATYQVDVLSQHEEGAILWLSAAADDLRLEVLRGSAGEPASELLAKLLQQQGQGWTAILNGAGDETLNPWGEGWRIPPAGLGQSVVLLTEWLKRGPPTEELSDGPWRATQGHQKQSQQVIGSLFRPRSADASFRSRLVSGGYGRGGDGDIVRLAWSSSEVDSAVLLVSTSKWPGEAKFTLKAVFSADIAVPEAFVPLWPLSELVTVRGEIEPKSIID